MVLIPLSSILLILLPMYYLIWFNNTTYGTNTTAINATDTTTYGTNTTAINTTDTTTNVLFNMIQ